MSWDPWVMVGVPVAAGVMTAAVLLGPAEERPVTGVEVHGSIAGGTTSCAFRLETLQHLSGRRQHHAIEGLEVSLLEPGGQELCRWEGDVAESGIAETHARMRRAAAEGETLILRVTHGRETLVEEPLVVAEAGRPRPPPSWTAPGEPSLRVVLPRGQVVPELPEPVLIELRAPRHPEPKVRTEVIGGRGGPVVREGVDCHGKAPCRWTYAVEVVARAPAVRLIVDVDAEGRSNHWEGDLPIVPGGIWLDRKALLDGEMVIRSATPRDEIFVSRYDATGRRWGTSVIMATDEDGFSEGRLPLPQGRGERLEVLRLSGAPEEPPEASTTWPFLAVGSLEGVPLRPLADSLPAAIRAEEQRMGKTRMPAFGLILAAGLFEVLFLMRRYRKEGVELDQRVTDVLERPVGTLRQRTPIAWLTFLSAVLVLAFFVLAAVAAWA